MKKLILSLVVAFAAVQLAVAEPTQAITKRINVLNNQVGKSLTDEQKVELAKIYEEVETAEDKKVANRKANGAIAKLLTEEQTAARKAFQEAKKAK